MREREPASPLPLSGRKDVSRRRPCLELVPIPLILSSIIQGSLGTQEAVCLGCLTLCVAVHFKEVNLPIHHHSQPYTPSHGDLPNMEIKLTSTLPWPISMPKFLFPCPTSNYFPNLCLTLVSPNPTTSYFSGLTLSTCSFKPWILSH